MQALYKFWYCAAGNDKSPAKPLKIKFKLELQLSAAAVQQQQLINRNVTIHLIAENAGR
jgi:hypothetical protein